MITLKVDGLTKKYNRKLILSQLSFEHNSGILGISGANGSGKSTLLKCLAYLLRPNSGSFSWQKAGKPFDKVSARISLGYAAPYLNLYDELTLLENLEFLGEVSRCHYPEEYYPDLLARVEMQDYKDRLFKSLSTGQQQRVKLAAALVRNPEILFLDEPGSNLDAKGHHLVQRIVEEQAKANKLVILATNDPNELKLCDNIVELGVVN
tara:strand:- start:2138 stop:2761 length:624 start_codon:yes stop_codon:yes gene_type:complete